MNTEFRKVKEREERLFICTDYPDEPFELHPHTMGSILWLCEQAAQAEKDPNREWLGIQAEWDQLVARTHPDPHPEDIIYQFKKKRRFKPPKQSDLKFAIFYADNLAYNNVMLGKPEPRFGYPARSQQLHAAECRLALIDYLSLTKHLSSELALHERLNKDSQDQDYKTLPKPYIGEEENTEPTDILTLIHI